MDCVDTFFKYTLFFYKNTYNLAEPEDVLILFRPYIFLNLGAATQPQRSYKKGSYKIKRVYIYLRINEHTSSRSSIGKHMKQHGLEKSTIADNFSVLKKCRNKFDFLVYEMLFTAVSRKVVQQKSIKAYASMPKGMMGCGCSLLHRQVHEFSARWKAGL